ncbi:tRNA (adenosine(37)-N6)-threonylcarbamoyltransferase complex dimerization subunit type 1 TsaB [Roseovarius sp. E0-M6]|uniref:tRNA (adenosine(37)-N6)-threonylcarbamoyltransferase complex dimerization subunit type 1 TsaB n=1 Tax=Roseovarius sp. E0-M6 TaxID=3127118 RepID=UPI00300F7ECD
MPSDTLTLGIDTSAAHCAAALLSGDRVLASCAETMTRGQAERLMPLIQEMLSVAGVDWSDLSRIGVGVGPGNFTGIRVGVSAARGLALALDVPAIGVSGFEVIADGDASGRAVVPAPQGQFYALEAGRPVLLPESAFTGERLAHLPDPAEMAIAVARCAQKGEADAVPLYVKPAEAAPPRDTPPEIVDDPV